MVPFWTRASRWIGQDLRRMNELRTLLDHAGIGHRIKTRNRMGQWLGRGTLRGRAGGLGVPAERICEYEIPASKTGLERARRATGLR